MADSSPKTPEKVERIPKDESFKTCKTTVASPKTRRKLRMTPARASILSGGKPFQEGNSSSKVFNRRRRHNVSGRQQNETAGSNDTFTRCEQELMFDRDSLEVSNRKLSKSSTPKQSPLGLEQLERELALIEHSDPPVEPSKPQQEPQKPQKEDPKPPRSPSEPTEPKVPKAGPLNALSDGQVNNLSLSKQPTFLKKKNPNSNNNNINNRRSPRKAKSSKNPSPKKGGSSPKKTMMPPPAMPKGPSAVRRSFITPQVLYKKPSSLASTASRYLSSWNNSYIARTRSYKSTAELERDYFSSLRSF